MPWLLLGFLIVALCALAVESWSSVVRIPDDRSSRLWAGYHLATDRAALAALLGACAFVATAATAATVVTTVDAPPWLRLLCAVLCPVAVVAAGWSVWHAGEAISSVRVTYGATRRAEMRAALARRPVMMIDMEGDRDADDRGDGRGQITGPDA